MFDVDETLEVSGGPVQFSQLINLKKGGHIIGLCGNWAVVTRNINNWHKLFSLVKVSNERKHEFLSAVKKYVSAERYIMVGNINPSNAPYSDKDEAELAGWEFIEEHSFYIEGEKPRGSAQTANSVTISGITTDYVKNLPHPEKITEEEPYQKYLSGDWDSTEEVYEGSFFPEVSIVVPTVNSPTFTATIDSLREKTKIPCELIIVCDCPNDEKRKTLEKLGGEEGVTVIIGEERLGNPSAFNRGVHASRGKYIVLTHDDITVQTDGWLEPMVEALRKHPEFGYVVPLVYRRNHDEHNFGDLGESSVLTRELIDKVGDWDESDLFKRLACDGDYFIRIKREGYRPHGIIGSTVVHQLGSTIKMELEIKDVKDNMEELYRRYGKEEVLIDRRKLPAYHGEELLPKW